MEKLANLPEDPLDMTQDPNPDLWDSKSRGCYPVALQALGQKTQPYNIVVHYSQGDARASEEEDQYASSFPYLHCPPQAAHYTLGTTRPKGICTDFLAPANPWPPTTLKCGRTSWKSWSYQRLLSGSHCHRGHPAFHCSRRLFVGSWMPS